MANIGFFDSNSVAPSSGNDPFPKGDYTMAITESEVRDTKAGTGKYIQFVWTVLEGEHKGRKVWQFVNFLNQSAKAQQIGQGELSAICRACAKPGLRDTSELHNIPVKVRIGLEPDQNGNERNCVKSVLWKEKAGGGSSGGGTPTAPAVEIDDDAIPF